MTSRASDAAGESGGGSEERTCSSRRARRIPSWARSWFRDSITVVRSRRALFSASSSARRESGAGAGSGRRSTGGGAASAGCACGSSGSQTCVKTGCGSVAATGACWTSSGEAVLPSSIFASFCAGGSGVLAAMAARMSRSSSREGRRWIRSMARAMSPSDL